MGNGVSDYMTNRLFLPLSVTIMDWTGIQISPIALLFLTIVMLASVVLYIMKSI